MAQTGGGAGGWYVITVRKNPQSPFTVQVSQKPFPPNALEDSGPYATKALAEAAAAKLRAAPVPGLVNTNPLSGLAAIGDFFGRLSEPATWLRVGEVILGIVLIAVGLAKLTRAVPIATKIASIVK